MLKLLLHTDEFAERIRNFLRLSRSDRRKADRNLAEFYAVIWKEAADSLNAEITDLGFGVFEIRRGDVRTLVQQNSTAIDDLITHCVVRTKAVAYRLLVERGIPVPRHCVFTPAEIGRAMEFLDETGECVVKPSDDSGGGFGVTTGVRGRMQLTQAVRSAARHSSTLLIEEQVAGDNIRLLYLDGELLDAVHRRPPGVFGDGQSTLEELIRNENRRRLANPMRAHAPIHFDLDLRHTLKKQGHRLGSIPSRGFRVKIKTATNENSSDDNESVKVCDSVISDGARAARAAGVRLAGVDILTPDPSSSLRKAGGVVIDVNSPPGYFWHYRKRDGEFPVARHVLERLLIEPKAQFE